MGCIFSNSKERKRQGYNKYEIANFSCGHTVFGGRTLFVMHNDFEISCPKCNKHSTETRVCS